MYLYLVAGAGALLALFVLGRLFVSANPAALARGLRVVLIALALLLALLVLARGLPVLAAALGAVAAFGWKSGLLLRLLSLAGMWRAARAAAGGAGPFGPAPGAGSAGGTASEARTDWLAMQLDHATGRIDGSVVRGPFAGRRLDDLSEDELRELWRAVRADAHSLRLLEAWLDRGGGDWRERFRARAGAAADSGGGAMTREEALSILGLEEGAGPEEVKAAHRELMQKLHPDHGGSGWFAAKLNQAKSLLLGE